MWEATETAVDSMLGGTEPEKDKWTSLGLDCKVSHHSICLNGANRLQESYFHQVLKFIDSDYICLIGKAAQGRIQERGMRLCSIE